MNLSQPFFFLNWGSLHAGLNRHYEVQEKEEEKDKDQIGKNQKAAGSRCKTI